MILPQILFAKISPLYALIESARKSTMRTDFQRYKIFKEAL